MAWMEYRKPRIGLSVRTQTSLESRSGDLADLIELLEARGCSIIGFANDRFDGRPKEPYSRERLAELWEIPQEVWGENSLFLLAKGPPRFTLGAYWTRNWLTDLDCLAMNYEREALWSHERTWLSLWLQIILRLEVRIRVASASVCALDESPRRRCHFPRALGIDDVGWLHYFGPPYQAVLGDRLDKTCSAYSDVVLERTVGGGMIYKRLDSVSGKYWESDSHRAVLKTLEPLLIPEAGWQEQRDAAVVPALDFSEMRKGYEAIPALVEESWAFICPILDQLKKDPGPLAELYREERNAVQNRRPGVDLFIEFDRASSRLARAFRKIRHCCPLFGMTSLEGLPEVVKMVKGEVTDSISEREAIVGLGAFIGECYGEIDGRWQTVMGLGLCYPDKRLRCHYVFPFLEVKRLWGGIAR